MTTASIPVLTKKDFQTDQEVRWCALQRIHLAGDFLPRMSYTRARFCLAPSSLASASRLRVLNLVMPAALLNDGAAILGLGAEDLADAALLDDGVAFRAEARCP